METINLENFKNTNKILSKKLDKKSKLYCDANFVFAKNMSSLLQDILYYKLEQLIQEKTKSILEDQALAIAEFGISKLFGQSSDIEVNPSKYYSDIDDLEMYYKSIIRIVPTLNVDDLHKLYDIVQNKPLLSALEFIQKNGSGKIFIGHANLKKKSNYLHTPEFTKQR